MTLGISFLRLQAMLPALSALCSVVASFTEAGESCRATAYQTPPINGRGTATVQAWQQVPGWSLNQFRMVLATNNAKTG